VCDSTRFSQVNITGASSPSLAVRSSSLLCSHASTLCACWVF
jgi:hypothetical protein